MNWRPKGWKTEHQSQDADWEDWYGCGFEAGADAMLEALREMGSKQWSGKWRGQRCGAEMIFHPDDIKIGTLVFIPEDLS